MTSPFYQSLFNQNSFNAGGSSFGNLLPDRLVYGDSNQILQSATLSPSLVFSAGQLSTAQDIRYSASPLFSSISLTNPLTYQYGGTGLSTLGSNGQVLKTVSGSITWADESFSSLVAGSNITITGSPNYTVSLASVISGVTSLSAALLTSAKLILDNTSNNNIIGNSLTGSSIISGINNIIFGASTGRLVSSGSYNCLIGPLIAYLGNPTSCTVVGANSLNNTGNSTYGVTAIGTSCGISCTGDYNTFIGFEAGRLTVAGTNNTYLGAQAGRNSSGSYNIFIGDSCGANELGSNKLYIHNTSSSSPLVYGDFSTQEVKINGSFSATNPIACSSGGTGIISFNTGDILYANTTSTLDKLNIGTNGYVLTSNGSVPQWAPVPGSAVTSVSGTANQITVSPTTGACIVSLPAELYLPGKCRIGSSGITDYSFLINRTFTTSSNSIYGALFGGTLYSLSAATQMFGYGISITNNFISAATNTAASYYGLHCIPSFNGTAANITAAYGIYSKVYSTIGTINNAYSGYFEHPFNATNSCALYSDNLQVGDVTLAPNQSQKQGYAYIQNRLEIGSAANNIDKTVTISRVFTLSGTSGLVCELNGNITTKVGATANTIYHLNVVGNSATATSNTSNTFIGLRCQPAYTASASTLSASYGAYIGQSSVGSVTASYGLYCQPSHTGTVTSSYSAYIPAPSGTATNKVALYTDSIKCGGGSVSGAQADGTIVSTGQISALSARFTTAISGLTQTALTCYSEEQLTISWYVNSALNIASTVVVFTRIGRHVTATIQVGLLPTAVVGSGYPYTVPGQIPSRYAVTTPQSHPVIIDNGAGSVQMGRLYMNSNPNWYIYANLLSGNFAAASGWNIIPYTQSIKYTIY